MIDLLLCKGLVACRLLVLFHGFLVHLLGQILESFCFAFLVHDLSAQHINLTLVLLVLRSRLIEQELLIANSVLLTGQLNHVKFVIVGSRQLIQLALVLLIVLLFRAWLDLLDVGLLLSKFMLNLLDLVLKDLQSPLLVLKLLSVDVHLILEPLSLALMNGIVTAADGGPSCN